MPKDTSLWLYIQLINAEGHIFKGPTRSNSAQNAGVLGKPQEGYVTRMGALRYVA